MNIAVYHLIDGAKQAEGLAVIIDVFRAFSMECWLYALGAREVRPVGSIEETFAWREKDPDCILVGERQGKRIEGCDLGNSPSSISPEMIRGRRIIHTTSAGTQGIVHAVHADEILTGSFVNAEAVARYIRAKSPDRVSLVCMGKAGLEPVSPIPARRMSSALPISVPCWPGRRCRISAAGCNPSRMAAAGTFLIRLSRKSIPKRTSGCVSTGTGSILCSGSNGTGTAWFRKKYNAISPAKPDSGEHLP